MASILCRLILLSTYLQIINFPFPKMMTFHHKFSDVLFGNQNENMSQSSDFLNSSLAYVDAFFNPVLFILRCDREES